MDAKLQPAGVNLAAVTLAADRPMLNNLIAASTQTVQSKSIPNVKSVEDVLKLQDGVVKQGNYMFQRGGNMAGMQVPVIPMGKPLMGEMQRDDRVARKRGLNAEAAPAPGQDQSRYYRAREFPAPLYSSEKIPEIRDDFRSTIFWKGNVTLGKSGTSVISFYNSDQVTTFRATVEGISRGGLIGRAEKTYYTQLPFSMAVKVPAEVSMGDLVRIPLTLKNNTDRTIGGRLTIKTPQSWKPV